MVKDAIIFLSHASEDEERVIALARRLEAAACGSVWLDRDHVTARSNVADFVNALNTCSVFILCQSPSALASPWVQREANWAASRGYEAALMKVIVSGSAELDWNSDGNFVSAWEKVDLANLLTAPSSNQALFKEQCSRIVQAIANHKSERRLLEPAAISQFEWHDVWSVKTGVQDQASYDSYSRFPHHVKDKDELALLFSTISEVCGCEGQDLGNKVKAFLAVYPASYARRFRIWADFAKRNGVGPGWQGCIVRFSFSATCLNPKDTIAEISMRLAETMSVPAAIAETLLSRCGAPVSEHFGGPIRNGF